MARFTNLSALLVSTYDEPLPLKVWVRAIHLCSWPLMARFTNLSVFFLLVPMMNHYLSW